MAVLSLANSTQTALSADETYQGNSELSDWNDVMVSCIASHDSTLYFDFSPDGNNYTTFPTNGFTVVAGIHSFHTAVKGPRYFRVRLVNGSTNQTYLRLYTYYGNFSQGNAPINQTISADADAIIVRSVSSDLDLAFGRFSGLYEDAKFGRVKGIDAADNAFDIWSLADDTLANRLDSKTFPSVAATLYVMSSSGSDTAVTVDVSYIDANGYAAVAEDVALQGQTPVTIGATGLDINRIEVSGATGAVGHIYGMISNNQTGGVPDTMSDVIAHIPIGYNQTQQTHFTVPIDKKIRIKHMRIYASRANGGVGSIEVLLKITKPSVAETVKREYQFTTATPVDTNEAGLVFVGGTKVRLVVEDVSDGDTNVSCTYDYDLIDV